jgi:hypothetical protein
VDNGASSDPRNSDPVLWQHHLARDGRPRTSGGARDVERRPGDRKGNPLKGEPHECRRYETRPAG